MNVSFYLFSTMEYTKTQRLMGSEITLSIFSDRNPQKELSEGFGIIASLECEFSRFLPDSALSLLNEKKTLLVSARF